MKHGAPSMTASILETAIENETSMEKVLQIFFGSSFTLSSKFVMWDFSQIFFKIKHLEIIFRVRVFQIKVSTNL